MKKIRNTKKIIGVVAGLAAVSVATVGFSSWVISANSTSANTSISVSVGDLVDNRFTASISGVSTDALCFDANSTTGGVTGLSGSANNENMSFGFALTLESSQKLSGIVKTIWLDFDTETTGFSALCNDTYLCTPVSFTGSSSSPLITWGSGTLAYTDAGGFTNVNFASVSKTTYYWSSASSAGTAKTDYTSVAISQTYTDNTDGSSKLVLDFILGFGWGSAFDYKNPVAATEVTDAFVSALSSVAALSSETSISLKTTVNITV